MTLNLKLRLHTKFQKNEFTIFPNQISTSTTTTKVWFINTFIFLTSPKPLFTLARNTKKGHLILLRLPDMILLVSCSSN